MTQASDVPQGYLHAADELTRVAATMPDSADRRAIETGAYFLVELCAMVFDPDLQGRPAAEQRTVVEAMRKRLAAGKKP